MQAEINADVAPGSDLMTDEDRAFKKAARGYTHHMVNHSAGEYVGASGYAHTNTIESVWALLKSQIIGIHHRVSEKHFDRYVQEMTWRWNNHGFGVTDRMNDLFACVEGRLTYKALELFARTKLSEVKEAKRKRAKIGWKVEIGDKGSHQNTKNHKQKT